MKFPFLARHCKRLAPLLAAPAALLLSQGQAKAILNVNIFDDGPNLKVTVNGSIAGSQGILQASSTCGKDGVLYGQFNSGFLSLLCSGNDSATNFYTISGPAGFGGSGFLDGASLVQGLAFQLIPSSYTGQSIFTSTYGLDANYINGQPFFSGATFDGTSLASEGFTATGLIGIWTIDGTSESINVCIGAAPCGGAPVPGPLPLLGAGAAFGWSRRLRKRIAAPLITPPQA